VSRAKASIAPDLLSWPRDVRQLSPEAAMLLGAFVLTLLGSVLDSAWRCWVMGARARVLCVSFVAFAVLCTRTALSGATAASPASASTYFPACFLSIFISFALADAWGGASTPASAPVRSVAASGPGTRRVSRAGLLMEPPAIDPPPPALARCCFVALQMVIAFYVVHQMSSEY